METFISLGGWFLFFFYISFLKIFGRFHEIQLMRLPLISIWSFDWTGHPNMGGAMQRMTPPRGMVPLGPQVWPSHLYVCISHLNYVQRHFITFLSIVPGIWRRHETTTQCSWGSWDAWDEYVRTSYYTNKYLPNNTDYFLLSRTIVNEYNTSLSITGVPEEDRGQILQIPTRWVISPFSRCEMSATTAVGKCLHLKSIWFVDILSVFSVWSDPHGI